MKKLAVDLRVGDLIADKAGNLMGPVKSITGHLTWSTITIDDPRYDGWEISYFDSEEADIYEPPLTPASVYLDQVREWAQEWATASSVSLHDCATELLKALDTIAALTSELAALKAKPDNPTD